MQPFDLIAAENATIPVTVVGKRAVQGILKLDGRKSRLELLSTKFFHFETDEKGWCDITLLGPKGLRITAHNAVFAGTGQSWGRGRKPMHRASIFPNTLIMNSRGHNSKGKVAQISFSLTGFNDFFHYQYIEELDPFDLDDNAKTLLKNLRYNNENRLDSFHLSHIYVCHRPKKVLTFKVDDRDYSIWGGLREGSGWHGIDLSIEHSATIRFKKPVLLDEALDRVYEWRQFFNQMAMVPLPIAAISISATNGKRAVIGDLYIPYLTEPKPIRKGLYGLSPAYLPLNRWEDRNKLAQCMKNWLKQAGNRRPFRARLDTVIEHMQEGTRQSDISELCSGIDSLAELGKKTKFPDDMIEKMAKAAFDSISVSVEAITLERVNGVLGQLQQRSLKEKMLELASLAIPENYKEDTQRIVNLAARMRQDAAHRGVVSEDLYSALQPVADALACLCVAYDLTQCGIPLFGEDREISNCINRFFNSMMALNT